jgi:hypothetical protein
MSNHNSSSSMPMTLDQELFKNKDYQTVMMVVKKLWDSEIIERSKGFCFSVSDMVDTLLKQEGITCRVVECQLTVINRDPPGFYALGYDHSVKNKEVPTHVVCITETDIPMIIDLSIGYIRPDIVPFVVGRATNPDPKVIAKIDIVDSTWIYTMKDTQYYPKFHQQNIVERIQTDRIVKKEISWLKTLVIVAILFAATNSMRGGYDFYQTYLNEENNFGPQQVSREELSSQIQRLEQLITESKSNK